jgi:hypothetical protein
MLRKNEIRGLSPAGSDDAVISAFTCFVNSTCPGDFLIAYGVAKTLKSISCNFDHEPGGIRVRGTIIGTPFVSDQGNGITPHCRPRLQKQESCCQEDKMEDFVHGRGFS